MTAGSGPHDALWAAMANPGELTLRMKIDLIDMLRPAVQPGSQLDHEFPPETVTVAFESSAALKLTAPAAKGTTFAFQPKRNEPVPVELRLSSPCGAVPLTVRFITNEDNRARPLPLRRWLLPWAETDLLGLGREAVAVRPPELDPGGQAKGLTSTVVARAREGAGNAALWMRAGFPVKQARNPACGHQDRESRQ